MGFCTVTARAVISACGTASIPIADARLTCVPLPGGPGGRLRPSFVSHLDDDRYARCFWVNRWSAIRCCWRRNGRDNNILLRGVIINSGVAKMITTSDFAGNQFLVLKSTFQNCRERYAISLSSRLALASLSRALLKCKYHLIKVTFTLFKVDERVQHP